MAQRGERNRTKITTTDWAYQNVNITLSQRSFAKIATKLHEFKTFAVRASETLVNFNRLRDTTI
jgi:hypothetical protein